MAISSAMTGKERFLKTLRFEPTDRPPHFESMFELEKEAFGLQFPDRASWAGCSGTEKEKNIAICMEIYERIVGRYRWDALTVYWPWGDPDGVVAAKRTFGDAWSMARPAAVTSSPLPIPFFQACRWKTTNICWRCSKNFTPHPTGTGKPLQ
jgi:hypothetical protein